MDIIRYEEHRKRQDKVKPQVIVRERVVRE